MIEYCEREHHHYVHPDPTIRLKESTDHNGRAVALGKKPDKGAHSALA
jgi:hypothetical protein